MFDPDQADGFAAQGKIEASVTLAEAGKVDAALAAYAEVKRWDPEIQTTVEVENSLCWSGSRNRIPPDHPSPIHSGASASMRIPGIVQIAAAPDGETIAEAIRTQLSGAEAVAAGTCPTVLPQAHEAPFWSSY